MILIDVRSINNHEDDASTIKRVGTLIDDLQRLRLNATVVDAAISRGHDFLDGVNIERVSFCWSIGAITMTTCFLEKLSLFQRI